MVCRFMTCTPFCIVFCMLFCMLEVVVWALFCWRGWVTGIAEVQANLL